MFSILARSLLYLFIPGGTAALSLKPWRSALALLITCLLPLVFTALRATTSFAGLALLLFCIFTVHLSDFLFEIREPEIRTKPNVYRIFLSITITIAIIITFLQYRDEILGIDLYYIPSNSMTPTLLPGDIVLADTWISVEEIKPGDVIVFEHPDAKGFLLIKRVIKKDSQSFMVAGDNRANSLDSRTLGKIALHLVKGKATEILRLYSIQKITHRIPNES